MVVITIDLHFYIFNFGITKSKITKQHNNTTTQQHINTTTKQNSNMDAPKGPGVSTYNTVIHTKTTSETIQEQNQQKNSNSNKCHTKSAECILTYEIF